MIKNEFKILAKQKRKHIQYSCMKKIHSYETIPYDITYELIRSKKKKEFSLRFYYILHVSPFIHIFSSRKVTGFICFVSLSSSHLFNVFFFFSFYFYTAVVRNVKSFT